MQSSPLPVCRELRVAELVAALSLGIDLGFGQPTEHVLRQTVISLRMADRLGLGEHERMVVYYTALLVNVGCHSDAHEQAKWFGDDIALRSTKYDYEQRGLRSAAAALKMVGAGNTPLHRLRVGVEFAVRGHRDLEGMIENHSRLARSLACGLGLGPDVQTAVGSSYERWDGKGWPGEVKGGDIPAAARITQFAEYLEVAHRLGGTAGAVALARKRAGAQFDPTLCDLLCADPGSILDDLDTGRTWQAVIAAEPTLGVRLTGVEIDEALLAVADFVDLKSPYTLGHSRGVSELAAGAALDLGLATDAVDLVRRAALVHDFGRLGVSNSIWDKPGPLGAGEWERMRMHPYLTERILSQSDALAPLGAIAVAHHERLDGSGYPRGFRGPAISFPARIVAAADAYQTAREPRPHRDALAADGAAKKLRTDVRDGRLDGSAVEAVLSAAGHRRAKRREGPAGLTAREVDVLCLLARGLSSRQVAEQLVVTPKTVRNHTEHIYAKIGTSSRAAASLFAVQNGLLAVD